MRFVKSFYIWWITNLVITSDIFWHQKNKRKDLAIIIPVLAILLVGCGELTTRDIYSDVKDGIVIIADEMPDGKSGIGTGFIINDDTIITNNHVVKELGKIYVYSSKSQKKYEAEVLYQDDIADLAILQIKEWTKFKEEQKPVNLTLGDSDEMMIGDKIIVIGHPWGLTWSVSEGIISAKNRRLGSNPKFLDQVDAHLFQGNSGGPIFNDKAHIICVSNMMLSLEGGSYGFCIPSDLVKKVVYDFDHFKEIRWRSLNVAVGLTDDGAYAILKSVEPGGAAGMAGLKEGDKLIAVFTPHNNSEGTKIKEPNDIITEVAKMKGDEETLKLLIDRNGEKMMIDVKTNYRLSKEYIPDKSQ